MSERVTGKGVEVNKLAKPGKLTYEDWITHLRELAKMAYTENHNEDTKEVNTNTMNTGQVIRYLVEDGDNLIDLMIELFHACVDYDTIPAELRTDEHIYMDCPDGVKWDGTVSGD